MSKVKPWQFGNTTVRSPFRLREGLIAIKDEDLEGKLNGRENEIIFCQALNKRGVMNWNGSDSSYSAGRKWRSAMRQLGFLQEIEPKNYVITSLGKNLIKHDSVQAWNECFLRSFVAYQTPSIFEKNDNFNPFSPFRFVLEIITSLGDKESQYLTPLEIGVIVQYRSYDDTIQTVTNYILELRQNRDTSTNKRNFDRELKERVAEKYGGEPGTINDYSDANIRYLKATGIFESKGRSIVISPSKVELVNEILEEEFEILEGDEYVKRLTSGGRLPYDNASKSKKLLENDVELLRSLGGDIDLLSLDISDETSVSIARRDIENSIIQINEEKYATQQSAQMEEILEYMNMVENYSRLKRTQKTTLSSGKQISLPYLEGPAYFEWIIWRFFLAVNSLVIKPWEARKFKIDQDFLPVGTAPGRGSDMIFEFEDFLLVVEVTLTNSSRQEAAEGEPVRRHVAQYAAKYAGTDKAVFGLFMAVSVDTNTANTFRFGEWYNSEDEKTVLNILPITLGDFKLLAEAVQNTPNDLLKHFKSFFYECRAAANLDAPKWKETISQKATGLASRINP